MELRKYGLLVDGVVGHILECMGAAAADYASYVEIPEHVGAGWRLEGNTWHMPEVPEIDRAAAIASRRWKAEIGGIVWNGWPVATDRDSQAKINAAYVMARDGYWPDGAGWKFADSVFRVLTGDQVVAMALAVAAHVQMVFAREAALMADPAADINDGWAE